MATQIGIIKAIIGTATATSTDGSIRNLQAGDAVFQNDLITTGAASAVEIEFTDGSVMDLGRNSQAMLDLEVFDPTAPVTETTETADVPDDVAALQEALLAGADVSELGEATAAGAGADAGGEEGGHSFVVRDYLGPEVIPDNGFDTIGPSVAFENPEELNLIIVDEEEPVVPPEVSVSVDVEIEVDPENPPPTDGIPTTDYPILVDGNAASVLEGTNGGEPREITFLLTLSEVFGEDVTVTYQLRPISADTPEDWFNGSLIDTVTIPAGTTQIPVTVSIVQDHLDEGNESFDIILLSATNATINPDADTAIVTIFDDDTTPVAQDDVNEVFEDDFDGETEIVSVDGNVIAGTNEAGIDPLTQNDTDEDGDVLEIVSFSNGDDTAAPGATLAGEYGTLTLNLDGSYTYVLDNDDPLIQSLVPGESLNDVFTYIVTDTYNAEQPATLTININGTDDGVIIRGLDNQGAEEVVYEANLPEGSDPDAPALTQTGQFSFEALDGLANISIGGDNFDLAALQALDGTQTISSPYGTLSLLSYAGGAFGGTIEYSYTLDDNVDNDSQAGAVDGSYTDSFAVVVTDENASEANASLDIQIIDDLPMAEDDGPEAVTEDGTSFVDGNVLDNDDAHADQPADFVDWTADGFDNAAAITALNTYGTLVQNANGSWSYALDNSLAATQALGSEDLLSYDLYYTMADADDDEDIAKLTITITGADDNATVDAGDGETIFEAGLPAGSANDDSDLVVDGSLSISASDGIASVTIGGTVFTFAEVQAFNGTDTVNTGQGVITLNSYTGSATNGTISYDYALSATIDNDSAMPVGPEMVDGDSYLDVVEIEVNGVGGSNATDDLEITIVDDSPDAADDNYSVDEDGVLNDTVATNDIEGADGGETPTFTLNSGTANGMLVFNADGSFTYTPNANFNGEDSFEYTITDADGDTDIATATITIDPVNDAPVIVAPDPNSVSEEGLAGGIADAVGTPDTTNATVATGTVAASDLDGDSLTFTLGEPVEALTSGGEPLVWSGDGTNSLTARSGVDGPVVATLTINNDGDYEFTLLAPIEHGDDSIEDAESLTFGVTVSDGSLSDSTTLTISIEDDSPEFTLVNDGNGDGVVNISAGNEAATYSDVQFADWSYGADGFGSYSLTDNSTDGTVMINELLSDADTIVIDLKDGDGILVAQMTLNSDGTDSLQTFFRESDTEIIPLLTSSVTASGPELVKFIDTPDLFVTITGSDGDATPGEADDEVNPSTQGWAVSDNQVDEGESITFRFDRFVNNFSFAAVGFTGSPSGGTVGLIITVSYNESGSDSETFFVEATDGAIVNVDQLVGFGSNMDGSTTIWAVKVESNLASQDGNDGFRLNNVSVTTTSTTPPEDLSFDFTLDSLSDEDGDTVQQDFSVNIDGTPGGLVVEAIAGTSGDDVLTGTPGEDVIIGGGGNDILTGGDGADLFVFNDVDLGDEVTPAEDEITDFDEAEGDVIDLSDVLGNPDNSIAGMESDGHLQIQVINGGQVVQTIDVNTIAVADNAAAQTALNSLISSGAVDDGI